jgi:asparagine synthase (glutamine-hydrolysing)
MCGIAGRLNFDRDRPIDRDVLREMMDRIQHRGPDGGGEYVRGPVGLGHRRLSIIDLATGSQPMCNEDGTIWVVYNGEIYNFRELRTSLESRGHVFRSTSDTEVIVHLYEEMGERCVTRLQGMFAFALWDERKQQLLLARDRVGIKPLYFANVGNAIIFASEIKSLLADPELDPQINLRAIDRFITYYYPPDDQTLFDSVRKLPPGHYLTVRDGQIAKTQYWDLSFAAPAAGERFDDAVDTLRELLSWTVRDHMISDVPLGILLSGGVDSTGLLSYAVRHAQSSVHTFTLGFAGAGVEDERPYARLAAQTFGTIHHEISLSADDFQALLPTYVWHMEEPVCEPPAIALYAVSRLARRSSVKVLLSGEGGDEAFGGYQTYRNLLLLEALKRALGPARGLLRIALQTLAKAGYERLGKYGCLVDPPHSAYYLSRTATPFTPFNRLKQDLYGPALVAAVESAAPDASTRPLFDHAVGDSMLNRMLYVDTKTWLPGDLLLKADKMTMATSVELRVPFLDTRVLEFAASLPSRYKVHGWELKRVLKAALRKSVPEAILRRKKAGFPVPYEAWLRNEMREYVSDTLLAVDAASASFFSRRAVKELLDRHQRGENSSKEVFCLLVLELWCKQFRQPSRVASPRRHNREASACAAAPSLVVVPPGQYLGMQQ